MTAQRCACCARCRADVVLSIRFAGTSEVASWCWSCAATVTVTDKATILRFLDHIETVS